MGKFADRYKTDKNAEESGVWVDYGDGLKIKIRRLTSKHSREVRRKLEQPYKAQFRNREMPDNLQDELLAKQLSKSTVIDWEGVEHPDRDGEMMQCNEENVLRMVTEFPDFRDDILTAAMSRDTFTAEERKDGEKNSQNSSDGS